MQSGSEMYFSCKLTKIAGGQFRLAGYFDSGQPPSFSGRNASSPGIVATTFSRSHFDLESSGFLTSRR